jgi:hypothetical protein
MSLAWSLAYVWWSENKQHNGDLLNVDTSPLVSCLVHMSLHLNLQITNKQRQLVLSSYDKGVICMRGYVDMVECRRLFYMRNEQGLVWSVHLESPNMFEV